MNDIRLTAIHLFGFFKCLGWWRVVRTIFRGDALSDGCGETYVVRVGESNFAGLVVAGGYALENSAGTPISRGASATPRDVSLRLVTVRKLTGNDAATDEEILAAIPPDERQATDEETLAFGAKYPDAQRKALIIGNLTSSFVGRRVLVLSAFIRVRYLYIGRTALRWLGCYRVLLASKSAV